MKSAAKFDASLQGLLAWRCGYATGLRVALQMMRDAKDPPARIQRELDAAMVEAKNQLGRTQPAKRD